MQNDCLQYYTIFGFTIDQDNKSLKNVISKIRFLLFSEVNTKLNLNKEIT